MGIFKKSRKRATKQHSTGRKLRRVEPLEDRRMMAVLTGLSTFDPQLMGDNIEMMSDGNTVGYGYAINHNGSVNAAVGSGGLRRTAADTPERNFWSTTELEISSVSKTVTATAILNLLQSGPGGLDAQLNTLLEDYLPSDWNPGANVENITLRHLLSHRSGFLEVGNSIGVDFNTYSNSNFANLQALVEAGLPSPTILADDVFDTPRWAESYNNANFSLLAKVVLPKLVSPTLDLTSSFIFDQDWYSGLIYESHVREEIFEPMGISDAEMETTQTNPAIGYNIADGGANPGRSQWDLRNTGGAFGWKLTARELATFLDAIEHDNSILLPATRTMRDQQELGWFETNDAFGSFYAHNGSTSAGSGNFRSRIVSFPGDIQASYLMNSEDTNLPGGGRSAMLKTAYVNAWTDLTVGGTFGDDNIVLRLDNSGLQPSVEVVLNGEIQFTRWISTLDSVTINSGFGDDTIRIEGWNAGVDLTINGGWDNDQVHILPSVGNLEMVNGMTFNGSLGSDIVYVHDHNNPYSNLNLSRLYTVTETGVSRFQAHPAQPWNPAMFLPVGINYTGVESGNITTGDQHDIVNIASAFEGVMNVRTGAGNDLISLGSSLGDLSEFENTYVNGESGIDSVHVYDHNMTGGALAKYHYDVNHHTIERYKTDLGVIDGGGGSPTVYSVHYSNTENLELSTSEIADIIRVHETTSGVTTVNGGAGNDSLFASPDDQNMEMVDDLTFNGEAGADKLYVRDQNNPYGFGLSDDYSVSGSRVIRGEAQIFLAGSPANINVDYSSVEDLTLNTGSQSDTIDVDNLPWTEATLFTGEGDDVVNASTDERNMELVDGLKVYGGLGIDEFNVFDQNNPYELPGGGRYTVSPSKIGRFEEHVLFDNVALPIDVEYSDVEAVSLATGSQGDEFIVDGDAGVGMLSLDGNAGADEFRIKGPAFEEINVAGDFPFLAPGDQLIVNEDGLYATASVGGVYPLGSGKVTIDGTTVDYSGIETVDLQEQLYGGPGDFDEDGDVDPVDLSHEVAGWHQRYGDDLSGKDFLTWQRHYGTGVVRRAPIAVMSEEVAEDSPSELLVVSLSDEQKTDDDETRSQDSPVIETQPTTDDWAFATATHQASHTDDDDEATDDNAAIDAAFAELAVDFNV